VRTANAIPGLGGDHRDGGKYSNGGVIDSVTTLNSSTILNMRASLSYWRNLIGPSDYGFDATQWGWPVVAGGPTDEADSVAEYLRLGRKYARQRIVQHHFRADHGAESATQHCHGTRQTDIKAGLDYRLTRYTQYRERRPRIAKFRSRLHAVRYLTQVR